LHEPPRVCCFINEGGGLTPLRHGHDRTALRQWSIRPRLISCGETPDTRPRRVGPSRERTPCRRLLPRTDRDPDLDSDVQPAGGLEAPGDVLPVPEVPDRVEELRFPALVLQIVGVLP